MKDSNDKYLKTKDNILSIKESLKDTMLEKLDPNTRWSYTGIFDKDKGGALNPDEKSAKIGKMRAFIESEELGKFVEKTSEVLAKLDEKDVASLGQANPTQNAKELLGLVDFLESKGFPMTNGKPINFWSGSEGRKQAFESPTLSDSDCPALCVMFDICEKVQRLEAEQAQNGGTYHLFSLLPQALSRVYASYSTGEVNVYMSSDKKMEVSGLTADNNFGEAELGTLQSLLQQGRISSIKVHTFENPREKVGGKPGEMASPGGWKKPVEINSQNADDRLKVIRRTFYEAKWDPDNKHGLRDTDRSMFPPNNFDKKAFETFQQSEPRSAINLGRLRNVAVQWRRTAFEGKVKKLAEEVSEAVKKGKVDPATVTRLDQRIADYKSQIAQFKEHGGKTELKAHLIENTIKNLDALSSSLRNSSGSGPSVSL